MDLLTKLYSSYDTLSNAKDDIAAHSEEYSEAIKATTGGEKEKRFAAQIISKFFKHFPALQSYAIDAVFDLCEDDTATIRIAAMKVLPILCKESNKYISRVADIIAQLLQLEDAAEFNVASNTLLQVLAIEPITVLKSIFALINRKEKDETTPLVREKNIKFLVTKIKMLDKALITQEVEDALISGMKMTLQDATANEFVLLMSYLTTSKYANSFTAQQEFIEIAAEIAEIDQQLDISSEDSDNTDRLITCVKYVLPFFSAKVESMKFVIYYCTCVLPAWDEIALVENGSKYQVILAQQLAEMSMYSGTLEDATACVVRIFDKLKEYMPPPPADTSDRKMPLLNFTIVESLLFAFHQIVRQCPEFLTHDEEVLKDFKARLIYFSRGVQGCLKVLNTSDKDKVFTPDEKKVREISPILLNNINALIRDFYRLPSYKCSVTLSFKTDIKKPLMRVPSTGTISGHKRHIPITYENGANKQGRPQRDRSAPTEKKIYMPPSGKYSHNFQNERNTNSGGGGRYRGGRSGGGRGRGRGRGGYRN